MLNSFEALLSLEEYFVVRNGAFFGDTGQISHNRGVAAVHILACDNEMKKIPVRQINLTREPNASEGFSIRDVGGLFAGVDIVQNLHRHDFYYVLALDKGAGKHEIDFTAYEVCDHAVFFMRPGQVHQHTLKAWSTGYLMEFKTEFYFSRGNTSNQLLRRASNTNFRELGADRSNTLRSILTHISREYSDKNEGYQEVIKANLDILFIELIRHGQGNRRSESKANTYSQERLEDFLELLERHISSRKQLSQYAEMMHLSSFQLNAIVRNTLGKSGSGLINEHIILESKRNLLATSAQVSQIADHLGYDDVSYFIRFFKKHTGYTPDAFRQNFK